ncbi:MAG: AEC family transporter [Oscillospiraceae bacterium]|nr:AEC family transporter [Oscillospiraceae bacterium]
MDMRAILNQLAVLFILLALGYVGCKIKALTPETGKILTKLVFSITLPCTILSSVIGGNLSIAGGEAAFFMLTVLLVYLIYLIIAVPTARFLGKEKHIRGLFAFMLIFSNVAFMGMPVASAIFGSSAVFYISLFNIPFWISSFSFGESLIASKRGRFDPKTLLNPVLLSSILVIPLALINFNVPEIIAEAVRLTGNVTTPVSMLIIGVTLAQEPLKKVFTNWRLYPLALVKLIIIPAVVWLVFRPFVTDSFTLGILVILSAMPTGAIAAMFAIKHENNESTASGGVFLTTLLSGATIPLIVYFLLGRI